MKPRTFLRGERVRVESGPFEGLEAVFDKSRGQDRVQVLVTVLGGLRAVGSSRYFLGSSLMALLIRFGWQQARRRALLRKCRAASKYHYPRR